MCIGGAVKSIEVFGELFAGRSRANCRVDSGKTTRQRVLIAKQPHEVMGVKRKPLREIGAPYSSRAFFLTFHYCVHAVHFYSYQGTATAKKSGALVSVPRFILYHTSSFSDEPEPVEPFTI